jgi:regulator of sirC expression with transglutaminase-like and TPR domain
METRSGGREPPTLILLSTLHPASIFSVSIHPTQEPTVGKPFADSPEFRRLLQGDDQANLTLLALELARDAYPSLNPTPYLEHLDSLAERVRQRCPRGRNPRLVLGQINWVLFVEEGFRGNTTDYYDPGNSYLNQVIDRRTGIPISLSVLYLALADRLGLAMAGVNLPAHFVLRLRESPTFVDPFHSGMLLDPRGCAQRVAEVTGHPFLTLPEAVLAPCSTRIFVTRMLRNLKAIYLHREDYQAVLPVLRRLVALNPDEPIERRDLGIVCMHTDHPGEATEHLVAYLGSAPEADDAQTVELVLRAAQRDQARRN